MPIDTDAPITEEEVKQATQAKKPTTPARVLSPAEILEQEESERISREFEARQPGRAAEFEPIITLEEALEVEGILGVKPTVTETVKIGTKTAAPEDVIATKELEQLRTGNPRLFKVLKEEGFKEYNKQLKAQNLAEQRRFNVEQFVVQQTLKRQAKLEKRLAPFKRKDGFNLGEAIKAGVSVTALKKVGFNKKQIEKGKEFAAYLKASPQKRMALLIKQGLIPRDAVFKRMDKSGAISYTTLRLPEERIKPIKSVSMSTALWRSITPWDEASGESMIQYIKAQRKRDLTTPTAQAKLKKEFDNYKNLPLWRKLITDTPVFFDTRQKMYFPIAIGYGPPIGTPKTQRELINGVKLGQRIVRVAQADDVGMTAEQFNRFLRWRVKNLKLSPKTFKFTEKLATEGVKVVDKTGKVDLVKVKKAIDAGRRPLEKLTVQQRRARAARRAAKGTVSQDIDAALATKPRLATTVESRMAIPGTLTAGTMTILINEWLNMPKGRIINSVKNSDAIAATIAYNPAAMAAILQKAQISPAELTKLKTQARIELKNANLTKSQTKAIEETLTEVATVTQTKVETKTQTLTKTEIEIGLQTKAVTPTKPKTVSPVKPKGVTPVKPTKPPKKPPTKPPEKPPTKPPKKPPTKPPEKPPTKPPTKFPPIKMINRGKTDRQVRRILRQARGKITWFQGELQGKDRWDVIIYPYLQQDYYITIGKRPANATVVRGPGAARRTAQLLFGKQIPKKSLIDTPGIFAVKIEPLGAKGIRLTHILDTDISKKGKVFPL